MAAAQFACADPRLLAHEAAHAVRDEDQGSPRPSITRLLQVLYRVGERLACSRSPFELAVEPSRTTLAS